MSNMIELDALDTLFFRDGKPFSMGEDTWAESLFPPPPSVIYGALRTAYFSEDINNLAAANTENDPTQNLTIKNICYKFSNQTNLYYPAPLDMVESTEKTKGAKRKELREKSHSVEKLELTDSANRYSSLNPKYHILLHKTKEVEPVESGFLEKSSLESYLQFGLASKVMKLSDLIISEPKVGIGRNNDTHTTNDTGMLYRVGQKRPAMVRQQGKMNIVVEFESKNIFFPERGIMRLGGEGKTISYQNLGHSEIDISSLRSSESNRFKLYLLTPAVFDQGWLASWMEQGEYDGVQFKFLGAAVGKPILIGGFDMKAGRPKAMRKAAPAGSVYFFELKNGTVKSNFTNLTQAFHKKSLSNKNLSNRNEGLGITFLGVEK